ncbi:DUF3164 family protein [Glaesserella parasuis]|uniref:DUF3164 family protein n=1 Tax=Glaesserella parasuis TaxID=738 RepID=A0A859IEH3_GLAPU|nr:DUF3164 family protein [Glaesserella parasuis]QKY72390.1 DUF3164 family protein [Glaesserella parasuis]
MQEKIVPEGYWKDARGALIPEDMIKPIDRERDALVRDLVSAAKGFNRALKNFKDSSMADIAAFVELSAEQYGAKIGGVKGNVTLYSFDGKYKIQRAISEHMQFDERIQAAKSLIDECLQEWTEGSRSEIKTLIERAFDVDKEGNLNTNKILALRRVDIQDDRWKRAMDAISESVQVVGSKSYIRFYERIGESNQYRAISLDMAGV